MPVAAASRRSVETAISSRGSPRLRVKSSTRRDDAAEQRVIDRGQKRQRQADAGEQHGVHLSVRVVVSPERVEAPGKRSCEAAAGPELQAEEIECESRERKRRQYREVVAV
jgi:hypothetical protein